MSNIFELPRDADGFLDMEAFPDAELEPAEAAQVDDALASSSDPTLDDDTWQSLVERAVDPDAPPVDEALLGGDDPYADVDDAENPFAGVDDASDQTATDDETDTAATDEPADDLPDDQADEPADDPAADEDLAGGDGSELMTDDDIPPVADEVEGLDALDTELPDHGL